MFRSCWTIFLALGLVFLPGVEVGKSQVYAIQAEGAAHQKQNAPETLPPPVFNGRADDQGSAEGSRESESESEGHDQVDMPAQQRMEEIAQRMLEVAEQQLNATWVGAGLVFFTLLLMVLANRSAVNAAKAATASNELIRGEQRPWLKIKEVPDIQVFNEGGFFEFLAVIDCENVGKSPAHVTAIHIEVLYTHLPLNCAPQVRNFARNCMPDMGWRDFGKIIFPKDVEKIYAPPRSSLEPDSGGKKYVLAMICVTYTTRGGKAVFHTADAVRFHIDKLGGIASDRGPGTPIEVVHMADGRYAD